MNVRAMLEQQLGSAYRIERELGGGGMSHVFLAEETALGRRVVVKVLPPEASATIDAERFRREIQLAASLQHPHIVTLLNTGAADGLLWYSMPFVEGESLRGRLVRDHELPVDAAVRIWRELLDALSYAHGRGIVHRDIKPENVLISGRHAVVTDFGVAKALSMATGGALMTGTGISLGTPAYMAPEQATADPSLDGRADIYAAGLVMYEMLVGHGPYPGLAPSQMMAAHATRNPESVSVLRPNVPAPLAALVMRCLEKRPADRPQSADEVLAALETIVTPAVTTPTMKGMPGSTAYGAAPARMRWSRRKSLAALVVGGVAIPVLARLYSRSGSSHALPVGANMLDTTVRSIGIVDFESAPQDSVVARAATDAVRASVMRSQRLFTLSRANQTAFYRWALDIAERETPQADSAAKVFIERGWPAVVRGRVVRLGKSFVFTADVVVNGDGSVNIESTTRTANDSTTLPPTIADVANAVRANLEVAAPGLVPPVRRGLATTSSQVALRLYQDASQAVSGNAADWGVALGPLREAVRVDTGFAPAWRRIARYLHNLDLRRSESLNAAARAYGERMRVRTWERALIDETYHLLHERFDQAAAAAAPGVQLGQADALTNAGYEFLLQGDARIAAGYLERSRAEARSFTYGARLLVQALRIARRDAAADSIMKWGATVSPASQHVSAATADGMIHRHDYRSLVTLLDRRMQSDTTSAASGVRVATLRELRASHQVLGHFRDAAATTNRLVDAILAFDSPADALRERMTNLADRAVWEADVAALRRAKDSLSSARLPSSTPTLDQPFNAEFDVWLAVGHVDSATSVLARWNQALTGSESTIDRNARLVARAELALARGDARRAVPMFRSAQQSKCGLCLSPRIARAYEALQQPDSALLEYEKYVGESTPFRAASDARELARTYKRLGELYEAKGDTKRAIQWYTDFVALWKNADTELQPKVTEIRERITQLQKKIG